MKKLILPTLLFGAFAASASAQTTLTKQNNNTSLNFASSWVENTVPTASNILVFDNTLTSNSTTANLGGNLTVFGINATATPVSGATRQWSIGPTVGATLTILEGGINKASNTSAFILNSAVILGANQTWTTNSVTGTGTGNLQMNGAFSDGGYNLLVTGTGVFDLRGSNTFGSNVTIGSAVSVNSASATVALGGTNTFTSLTVANGRIQVGTIGNFGQNSNAGTGGTNTAITLGSSGAAGIFEYTGSSSSTNRTFQIDNRSTTAGGIVVSSAATTLTVSGNLTSNFGTATAGNTGWTFGGNGNLTLSGIISDKTISTGVTSVTKSGAGTLTLSNANTYEGTTTVNAGTLLVNNTVGSGTGSGAVLIESAGTLGGSGTINGTVTVNGSLRPGNSIGTLTVANDVTWNSGQNWVFELGTGGTVLAPGASDRLSLTGAGNDFLKGTGAAGSFVFDFAGTGTTGWYRLVSWESTTSSGFAPESFAWTNLASGLSATFTVSDTIGSQGIYLNVIPEPSTWALIAVAGTALVVVRRRRKVS